MYCSNCGYSNAPGALLCAQCGVALTGAAPDPSQAGGYPPPGAQPPASGEYPPPGSGEYPPAGAPGGYGPQGYPPSAPVGPPGYPPAPPYGAPPPGGAPPGYGYGPPPGGGGPRSQKGLLIGVLAVLVVAAMVAGAVLVLGSGGDDDDLVVLEPIDHVQEDDFAGNRDLEDVGADIAIAMGDTPAAQPEVDATLAGGVLPGDEPGLYGGSQDDEVCDIEGLISFLQDEANADKAEAWAETLNISGGVGGIPDYIEGLTSVRLRFDTRVTNHGFRDGEANPFQSVLQAGTAVLVDAAGVPRVKCNCGNPLTEPTPLGEVSVDDADNLDDLAQNPDAAWPEFTIVNVVVVQLGDEVDQFVMMELEDGSLFTRAVGSNGDDDGLLEDLGDICASDSKLADSPTCQEEEEEEEPVLGTGDVQVTLRWGSEADLDLAVIEPDGTQIDFINRGPTATGGQLDVDGNPNCATSVSIENIFWPENQAPSGGYSVAVTGYNVSCGAGDYTLTIRVAGQQDQVHTGVVGEDEVDYYDFEA